MRKSNPTSIYVHVPFCRSICAFCDFKRVVYNKSLVKDWLIQLANEVDFYKHEIIPQSLLSLYIGGGTPSCLTKDEFQTLMLLFKSWIHEGMEITLEVNPEDINEDNVYLWKQCGINRLSIGVESFDPCMLKTMNRTSKCLQLDTLIGLIRNYGIHNISFDVMYGLPNQSLSDYKQTLNDILKLKPNHISAYCLTIEDNSVWAKKGYLEADEQLAGEMMELTTVMLSNHGYQRYEVSNYAQQGCASIHNQTYWHYDNFVGFGFGSSGKENDKRYDHCATLFHYLKSNGFKRIYIEESKTDIFEDYLMMNLRLKQPCSIQSLNEYYENDFYNDKLAALKQCQDKGYLEFDEDYIRMNDYGLDCLFDVLVLLLA